MLLRCSSDVLTAQGILVSGSPHGNFGFWSLKNKRVYGADYHIVLKIANGLVCQFSISVERMNLVNTGTELPKFTFPDSSFLFFMVIGS